MGVMVALGLCVLFVGQSWVAVEVLTYTSYDLINYPAYLLGIFFCALYRVQQNFSIGQAMWEVPSWGVSLRRTHVLVVWIAFVTFGISFVTKDKGIGRLFVLVYIMLSWATLLLWYRYGVFFITKRIFDKHYKMKTLLVGTADTAQQFLHWMESQLPLGLEVVGWISLDKESAQVKGLPRLGEMSDARFVFEKYVFQQVVYLDPFPNHKKVKKIYQLSEQAGVRLWIMNSWKKLLGVPLHYYENDQIAFFQIESEPLENPVNRLAKRALDVVVSLVALSFILPWLALVVAYKQRRESPGRLIYRQKRSGLYQRDFMIYKFRTMREGNPDEAKQATAEDGRVFSFGRLLRQHNLDEFPQFWNVLLGNMSVVGPRPHMTEHDAIFQKMVKGYPARSLVKPGLTGYAQIHGFRGEVTTEEQIAKRLELDHEYIRNWTLWLDVMIIIRTVRYLFFPQKTAY